LAIIGVYDFQHYSLT